MTGPPLEYEPPSKETRERQFHRTSPASVFAGGLLGIFFGPIVWGYAFSLITGKTKGGFPPLVAEGVAAVAMLTLAVLAGRHIERTMPDARGMAVGLYVSAALVAAGCVALGSIVR